MLATISLRSSVLRPILSAVVLAFACCPRASLAQNQPAASTQAAPASAPNVDYTKREVQPALDVDRDPVLSPDAANNLPVSPAAQGAPIAKSGANVYTLHENVNEVLLDCTVVDDQGRLARDLKAGDFRVWEDGVPQTIASFQHGDVPVSLGILVDNSGSMRDKRETANVAALNLVRASDPRDMAFIVNFNDKAYLDQGFTSNVADLQRGLAHFDATGTTAIYDAIAASADELAGHAKWPRQVLLIITDGADNASRLTLAQAVQRVQRLGAPVVYSIGLLYDSESRQEAQQARDALETLSNDTGGLAFFPRSPDEVDAIAAEVARDIRNQYIVGYHSTKSPDMGGFRTVHVEAQAPGHGRLTVRTRRGYYPQQIRPAHPTEAEYTVK